MLGALPTRADLLAGARLLRHVPRVVRRPVTSSDARSLLAVQLSRRSENLLTLLRDAVFAVPHSPYQALLRHAGYAYPDVAHLVRREGIEGALARLYRDGVYLTVDEYKGRTDVVRGSLTMRVVPERLANVLAARHLAVTTSGSRGRQAALFRDLEFVRRGAAWEGLVAEACAGPDYGCAVWMPPGGSAALPLLRMLMASRSAAPVWFSQLDPHAGGLHARYLWSAMALRVAAAVAGRSFPSPIFAPLDDPTPVLRWVDSARRLGRRAVLVCVASAAVALALAARRAQSDLANVVCWAMGEPTTAARRAIIEAAGATVVPIYGSMESGSMAFGCLSPRAPDDLHVLRHANVLVVARDARPASRLPSRAILVTSLDRGSSLVLLNTSLGDRASLVERSCGCPLDAYGWTPHIQEIDSFEKLTTGGMSLLDAEVARTLEEVLPGRFGGAPTDYQLVETPTPDASAQLALRVSPSVGPLDEAAVVGAFLDDLATHSDAHRVIAGVWRQGAVLRIERAPPAQGGTGKVLHVHVTPPDRAEVEHSRGRVPAS
jgi:hypothetical protein